MARPALRPVSVPIPVPALADPAGAAVDGWPAGLPLEAPKLDGAGEASHLPPPRPEMAWPSVADQRRKRAALRQRWILVLGFGLIVVAFAEIAYTAWLLGVPQEWVVLASVAMAPAAITALAALFGWRHSMQLALFVTAWQIVCAIVALVIRPGIGLPQAVCALAAIAVTAAAWRCMPPEEPSPAAADADQPGWVEGSSGATDPPVANTAG